MIVHGGFDILKEFSKENTNEVLNPEDVFIKNKYDIRQQNISPSHILGDFMSLDLISLKWMKLSNIITRKKGSKKIHNFEFLPRAHHSSCLILSNEHLMKSSKLNIYKGEFQNDFYTGKGTYHWPNGCKYVGDFKEDMKDGKGILYLNQGNRVEGIWKNNNPIYIHFFNE